MLWHLSETQKLDAKDVRKADILTSSNFSDKEVNM